MGFQIFDNYNYGKTVKLTCDSCGREERRKIMDIDSFLEGEDKISRQNKTEGWEIFLGSGGAMETYCPSCKREKTKFNDRPASIFTLLGWKETRFNITTAKLKILADRDKPMEPELYESGVVCPVCFHETHVPPSLGKCFCTGCGQRLRWKRRKEHERREMLLDM